MICFTTGSARPQERTLEIAEEHDETFAEAFPIMGATAR